MALGFWKLFQCLSLPPCLRFFVIFSSFSFFKHVYVAVPRKQLNQDFGTNMLLKPKLGINFKLTMAPDIPQCTLKMISIKTGPPFFVNEVK